MSVEREMTYQIGADKDKAADDFETKLKSFGLKSSTEAWFRENHRLPGEYVDPYSVRDL